MCGRYYFDNETAEYVLKLVDEQAQDAPFPSGASSKESSIFGDIRPSMTGLVLAGGDHLHVEPMTWGFPGFADAGKGRLIINARAETAIEKPMFSESVMKRRCIIPAKWFYEWDKDRNKASFSLPDHSVIFMAGFYDFRDSANRYVILTTAANESMIRTHDRMPLIFPEDAIRDWIFDDSLAKDFLHRESPLLHKDQEYEQLSLF